MHTGVRAIVLSLTLAWLGAGVAWAQADPFAPRVPPKNGAQQEKKEELPKPPRPDEILASLTFEVRQTEEIPDDLRGSAAIFPIGKKEFGFSGAVYVPSYYDAGRPWPVLVEGQFKRFSPLTLKEFAVEAEKHGFIAVCVELTYAGQGTRVSQSQAWNREGGTTVTQTQAFIQDYLVNMAVDEKNILGILKELGQKYTVATDAVGITGFLSCGLMSCRMVCKHPDTFRVAISRTGSFTDKLLPEDYEKGRKNYVFIVYGEKEDAQIQTGSLAAAEFFKKNNFSRLQVERIPYSGVDSRPEIVGNFFRGAFEEILGAEKSDFFRIHKMAVQCLEGVKDVTPRSDPKADAKSAPKNGAGQTDGNQKKDPASGEDSGKSAEPKQAQGPVKGPAAAAAAPPSPAVVMAALSQFNEQYPRSAFKGSCRFLMARVAMEKLDGKANAEKWLREFVDPPLLSSPLAPAAVLYLVEKVIDQEAQRDEAIQWLGKTMNRREASVEVRNRTRELRKKLLEQRDSAAKAQP